MKNDNTVSAMRIMEALSAVDEELLERCRTNGGGSAARIRTGKKPLWQYGRAWAAVLCMVVLGAAAFTSYQFMGGIGADNAYSGGMSSVPQKYFGEMEDEAQMAMDMEDAPAETGDILSVGGTDMESGQPETALDGGWDAVGQEGAADGSSMQNETGNGAVPGGDTAADLMNPLQGEESSAQGKDAAQEEKIIIDSEACRKLEAEEYTLEQARAIEGLGKYVPTKLPENYVFEGAYSNLEVEEANLTVSWSRGMDSLMLHIQKTDNAPQTVDIEVPERYDVRLYEIPYGETVPKEYRQTFDNPVFSWEDLNQDIVESRMKSYTDAGDTDTPRGSFAVLFPDGIVVRFNGRGTAAQIWEMFCSMNTDAQ